MQQTDAFLITRYQFVLQLYFLFSTVFLISLARIILRAAMRICVAI
jgi:hypothetical protein